MRRCHGPTGSGFGGSGGYDNVTVNGRAHGGYNGGSGVVIVRSTAVPKVYSDGRTEVTNLDSGDYRQFTEGDDTVTVFKADGFIEFS